MSDLDKHLQELCDIVAGYKGLDGLAKAVAGVREGVATLRNEALALQLDPAVGDKK